jgi:hypothetical protein
MDLAEYIDAFRKWDQETAADLTARARWLEQDGLPWMWAELGTILGKRVKALSPEHAIRQGLEVTPVDRIKMPLKESYHIANLTMLDGEARRICAAANNFANATNPVAPAATIYELQSALRLFLLDGLVLLRRANVSVRNDPGPYLIGKREQEHSFEIFKGAEQFIYGRYSGLTHFDRASFAPIAALRTAIEIRIRSAFGIFGYTDRSNNSLRPIDMREIFDVVQSHLSDIAFAVDFHDIVRIYRWSNSYLHAGQRDAVWIPGYALQYLRPLFADQGKTPDGGWSIDGGIRMKHETWQSIRAAFDVAAQQGGSGWRKPLSILREMWVAVWSVLRRRNRLQNLELNQSDEDSARCVFLD